MYRSVNFLFHGNPIEDGRVRPETHSPKMADPEAISVALEGHLELPDESLVRL